MIAESVDEEIARGVRRDGKHHHLVKMTQRSAYRFSPSLKLQHYVGSPSGRPTAFRRLSFSRHHHLLMITQRSAYRCSLFLLRTTARSRFGLAMLAQVT